MVKKVGILIRGYPDITFEEACVRWLEEKSDKKSLDTDKSLMVFWVEHFSGCLLRDITSSRVYTAVSKLQNRAVLNRWLAKKEACIRKGKDIPVYVPKTASQSTKSSYLALIKSILRAAEREWKWIDKAPIIKVNQPKNKRIRWLEPHEAMRLISECPEPLKSIVRFALATGLRRSNIVDLEWQQK